MFNLLKKVTNKSNQEQRVESESVALQAGNDINLQIGTLSPSDVNEICQIIFKANFPRLVEEAAREAERNMVVFSNSLEEKIHS